MAGMTPTNFPIMGGNPFGFSNNLIDTNFEIGGFFQGAVPDADKSSTDAYEATLERYRRAKAEGMGDAQALQFAQSNPDGTGVSDKDIGLMRELIETAYDPERQRALLEVQNEFDVKRMKQAAPYKLLFGMPQQIGQLAAMELAGAGKFAQIMDAGQRAMPSLSPGPTRAQARQAVKYF